MNQKVLSGLTLAFVVSSFGASLSSSAQQLDDIEPLPQSDALDDGATPHSDEILDEISIEASLSTDISAELEFSPRPELDISAVAPSIVRVYPHPLDDRQAATLYVRDIPVLTFLGAELATLQGTSMTAFSPPESIAASTAPAPKINHDEAAKVISEDGFASNPILRATAIASRINQLNRQGLDAETISAHWDSDQAQFVIRVEENDLVAIDDHIILPDTTEDTAEDTLQAVNRLRRLLGTAPPLQRIEGMPEVNRQLTKASNARALASGIASWYGPGFHGNISASGEVFNQNALTAAHRTLPFGTQVRVTNLSNNRQVVVRINDRGPFIPGRIIDLSAGAAQAIGLANMGVGPVQLEVLDTASR
ncbi:MAG: septal ring lytic transglycosylase RlpA family protein [Leptolyngbyaceae cyanobacterium MO_188.B28]|nr:septal ring lytic transglycosylase RlpA family protein [Leptolyngbyaceae cyanobacterium MO_188.B28]